MKILRLSTPAGPADRTADLLRRLADDPELGNAAARVLPAWTHGVSR